MWSQYLKRIGYIDQIKLDEATLIALHRQHVFQVPFEVLDIHFNLPFELNFEAIYDKVINRQRGGFCYELNYLFYRLLTHLGFKACIISSRIYDTQGVLGPEYDHMSILVELHQERWLLDVGYGDLLIAPLKITDRQVIQDQFKYFKIEPIDIQSYLLSESLDGHSFTKRYTFSTIPRQLSDFEAQFAFKKSAAESHFVQNLICTLPHQTGRYSIVNNKHIVTHQGAKTTKLIKNEAELMTLLNNQFNIYLENPPPSLF